MNIGDLGYPVFEDSDGMWKVDVVGVHIVGAGQGEFVVNPMGTGVSYKFAERDLLPTYDKATIEARRRNGKARYLSINICLKNPFKSVFKFMKTSQEYLNGVLK